MVKHKDVLNMNSFDNLAFNRIAVKTNSRHVTVIKSKHPQIEIVEINTLTEGLNLLSSHKVDGVFDDLAPLYHLISTTNFNNMEIAFIELSEEASRIALRNNDSTLLSVFNKAISSLSDQEKQSIQNKWIKITPQRDFTPFYIAISLLLLSILLVSIWSYSLKIIVLKKTMELEKELIQRKKTEKELRRAKERAVESDKLKSAFLANMSHEIRTPLNSIVGFSDLLTEDKLSSSDKKNYNEIINSSCNSLLSLINDIIDFSKIEAGKLETHFSLSPLKNLFNEIETVFKYETNKVNSETGVHVDFNAKIDTTLEGLEICTDKNRLMQIFTILINNAIKFTKQGNITVACKPFDKNSIMFYVKDTGIGISKENQKIIFERFQKIEDSEKILYRGAGLGLSIAKQLIELLHGDIWVESELEKGATFYFTIPS